MSRDPYPQLGWSTGSSGDRIGRQTSTTLRPTLGWGSAVPDTGRSDPRSWLYNRGGPIWIGGGEAVPTTSVDGSAQHHDQMRDQVRRVLHDMGAGAGDESLTPASWWRREPEPRGMDMTTLALLAAGAVAVYYYVA